MLAEDAAVSIFNDYQCCGFFIGIQSHFKLCHDMADLQQLFPGYFSNFFVKRNMGSFSKRVICKRILSVTTLLKERERVDVVIKTLLH